jgi:tetratricopeptide (TPR) repeat protein
MRLTYAFALVFSVSFGLVGIGCAPRATETPGTSAVPSPAASAALTAGEKPWPRISKDRPAPSGVPSLDTAETAATEKPNDPKAVINLGYAQYAAQDFRHAVGSFEKAVSVAPSDPQPLLYLGYSQMGEGMHKEAVATFQRVVDLKGVSREILSEAYFQMGDVQYLFLSDEKAAREAYSKSIGNNPKKASASLALGAIAAQRGQMVQARDFFEDALRDASTPVDKAKAEVFLGIIAQRAGDNKTAGVHFNKAIALDPTSQAAKQGIADLAARPLKVKVLK